MASITADAPASEPSSRRAVGFSPLAIGAAASLGAGAIHAAAVGAHSEHRQAVIAFSAVGLLQLAWGALALVRSGRLVAAAGVAINGGAVGGWLWAKTTGISFVDGLEAAEKIQWADALAMVLAAIALIAALRCLAIRSASEDRLAPRQSVLGVFGVGLTALSLFGMVAAGSHTHAGGHAHGGAETAGAHSHSGSSSSSGHSHGTVALATKAYDPKLPIDLSGVPGVTARQQARAENLIAITLIRLPHFGDYKVAEAEGYHSIGDGYTGHEHFINWDTIDDDHTLDPDHPESLVYEPQPDGSRKLVSAMFMLPEGSTLDDVPDVGGALTQWHIHDNLCFSKDPEAPVVAGITNSGGTCPASLQKFTPVPMIHVWITKHPCGPFAALEGVGAGQIKEGETRLCDHTHGTS